MIGHGLFVRNTELGSWCVWRTDLFTIKCVFAFTGMCLTSFSQIVRVLTVGASVTLTLFVKALTFAAAVTVACEHWVLLDLDQGVLKS